LVFLWARGFIGEQTEKFGKPIGKVCEGVEFDFERIREGGIDRLEVVNRKDVDIYNLQIEKIRGGNSEITTFKFKIDAHDSAVGDFDLAMEDNQDAKKVILTPVLIGTKAGGDEKSLFTCVDKSQGFTIS
jgi:hypothetical protein